MSRRKTLYVAMGLFLTAGVWAPFASYGEERDAPPREAQASDEEDAMADPVGETGRSPSIMRGPFPGDGDEFDDRRPGRQRMFGRNRPRRSYESLPEEQKRHLEDFVEQHFPDQFEELYRLNEEAPDEFFRKVNRLMPHMMRLMRLQHEDPEAFPLRLDEVRISMKLRALARRIAQRRGDGPNEKAVDRLRELLERRFDLRCRIHVTEVERIERRLIDARERLDRLAADKGEIIDRELDDMLSPSYQEREPRRQRESRRGRMAKPPRGRPAPPADRGP